MMVWPVEVQEHLHSNVAGSSGGTCAAAIKIYAVGHHLALSVAVPIPSALDSVLCRRSRRQVR